MVEPITENYSKLKGSRTTAPKEILPSNPNPNLNSNWGQFSLEVIIRTPSLSGFLQGICLFPDAICFKLLGVQKNAFEENSPRIIARRKIVPWLIAPRLLPPRTIALEDNCPRRKLVPRIVAPEEYSIQDNCPLNDCPWIIAPGQLLQR